jgi:hypothetical protein
MESNENVLKRNNGMKTIGKINKVTHTHTQTSSLLKLETYSLLERRQKAYNINKTKPSKGNLSLIISN